MSDHATLHVLMPPFRSTWNSRIPDDQARMRGSCYTWVVFFYTGFWSFKRHSTHLHRSVFQPLRHLPSIVRAKKRNGSSQWDRALNSLQLCALLDETQGNISKISSTLQNVTESLSLL